MAERSQMQIVLHGAIVLFIGLLGGIPFVLAVGNDWGAEAVRAWRVAHSGGVVLGLMLLVVGAVLHRLLLRDRVASVLVLSLVASAYSFTFDLVVADTGGGRGVKAVGPALNWAVFVAYLVGSLGAFLGVALVIHGAYGALRKASPV